MKQRKALLTGLMLILLAGQGAAGGLLAALPPGGMPAALGMPIALAEAAAPGEDAQGRYDAAQAYYEAQEYEKAAQAFEALGDFSDSRARAKDSRHQDRAARYRQALALYRAEEYAQAKALFEALDGYEKSRSYIKECTWRIQRAEYRQAKALYADGEYESAKAIFDALGRFEDSRERAREAEAMILAQEQAQAELRLYQQALALKEAGDLEGARDALIQAGDCLDATDQLYDVLGLLALKAAQERGDGQDAAAQAPAYRFTTKQLRDDKTSPLSPVFTAPDGTRHRYQLYKGVHTWVEAKAFCEVLGGHLATLTTAEENAFVYSFMRESGYLTAYFGLSDEERKGNWEWVTGEPFAYSNWNRGEPSRSGRERYGMYFYKHTKGTWNDSHFYEHTQVDPGCSFICEWDE